ncbi:hypothetical protein [Inconstantimicrobium mannanitabidum]|uniref:Uncharacterized protein n=1 Tax=Inconstantimicrobium mannanitabidum TaxID=1604901 RepID=A0ACB5RAE9_9CLOT|nr:hypothetical protein [Clostridium sp. TW13]GKX66026.1 hypothetical protein rsdtw13_12840 [Clostridium sp. TW13]
MKRKKLMLLSTVLIISVFTVLGIYCVKSQVYGEVDISKADIQGDLVKPSAQSGVEDKTGNVKEVVVSNVKSQSKEIDNKQLSVSSVKEIEMNKQQYIRGWYGNDSILAAEDINSTKLTIRNLVNGTNRTIDISNIGKDSSIVDYKDKKLVIFDTNNYSILNLESGKTLKIIKVGTTKINPMFVGVKGEYVLADNGKNFVLISSATGEKTVINQAGLEDYCVSGIQGFPYVTIGIDGDTYYFSKGNAIYKGSLKNPSKNAILTRVPNTECINSLALIKGQDTLLVSYYKSDNLNIGVVATVNLSNNSISSLGNISLGSTNDASTINMKNENLNKIIYEEKAPKSGITQIYISELKENKLTKTKNILSKEFDVKSGQWQAMWNQDGTRVFVSIYNNNGYKNYLVSLGR